MEMHLRNRMAIFREQTGTHYGTQLTLITTFGVLKNKHYSVVDSEVTLDDLFWGEGFFLWNNIFGNNPINYSNLQEGISETTVFLERFFRNMLLSETIPLRNRETHLDWKTETDIQTAKTLNQSENSALPLPP